MSEPAPVVAPSPATDQARVIRQTGRGRVFGSLAIRLAGLWPLALLERGFGVNGPAANQLWIVPIGLVAFAFWWKGYAYLIPRRGPSETLTVSPERLQYDAPGGPPAVIDRTDVGLVGVTGSAGSGIYTVIVWDQLSHPIGIWEPRLAGWEPESVVKVLREAGYPAALHGDIYDGRFQRQVPGQPARAVRA